METVSSNLFRGPFLPVDGYRAPDVVLASSSSDDSNYAGPSVYGTPAPADLDQDGGQRLVALVVIEDPRGARPAVIEIDAVADGLSVAAENPVLELDPVSNACFRGPTMLDANADGWTDLAIGNACADVIEDREGQVFLEYGPFEGRRLVREGSGASISGVTPVENLSYDVDAGDTDGDGYDDLALGTYLVSDDEPGTTWIFLGGP